MELLNEGRAISIVTVFVLIISENISTTKQVFLQKKTEKTEKKKDNCYVEKKTNRKCIHKKEKRQMHMPKEYCQKFALIFMRSKL